MAELISAAELARQIGVTPAAVTHAVKENRISVIRDERGRPRFDPQVAAREWQENSQYRHASSGARALLIAEGSKPKRNIADVRLTRETFEAKMAELKLKKMTGELVPVDEVESAWASIVIAIRTKLMAVPTKARLRAPDLSNRHVELLEELIREALEDLGGSDESNEEDSDT